MSIENFRMENKTDINNSAPIRKVKHTLRYVAARIAVAGSMLLPGCASGIKGIFEKQDINSNESTPPQVNVETIPTSNSEISIPAPVPTEQGEKVEIFSADYPATPDNFILTDTRTNEEKTELIKSWAPDDYDKEVALYRAEIERMGQGAGDFEFEASIVDGKSWVVVPENIKTGRMYVPKIGEMIQSSLHLWGQLDRTDDFFDLVEVGIDNPKLMGDKSGWHLIAQVENGQRVRKWYDAAHDQIREVTPEPTPTQEKESFEVKFFTEKDIKTMYEKREYSLPELTRITLDDFFSEKIQKAEDEWLEKHPFSKDVVPMPVGLDKEYWGGESAKQSNASHVIFENKDKSIDYVNNPAIRPVKPINYYVLWDKNFFEQTKYFELFLENIKKHIGDDPKKMQEELQILEKQKQEKYPFIGIITWAIYNSDGTTSKVYGITPFDFFNYYFYYINHQVSQDGKLVTWEDDLKPSFVFETTIKDFNPYAELYVYPELLWKFYPELSPKPYIDEWLKTDKVPAELERKILSIGDHYYDPWWN